MQRLPVSYKLLSRCLALVFAGLLLPGFLHTQVQAQGTAQMVISGIPPVLPSPYISDLERSYEQGFFTSQFIYVSPSRQPQSFRFHLTLEHNGQTLIDVTSEPNAYIPGIHVYRTLDDEPAIQFPIGYGDIVNLLDASVDQNGLLPEGDYLLTIEPEVEDELALIPTVPGMAFFSVRYAEPPLLLSPFDNTNLTTQFPVFSWTPVTGAPLTSSFEYEFTVVEVFPGQTPYQALESNIPHIQESLVGQTSFVYTLEQLPLEEGKLYAWQAAARDVNEQMPVLYQGESEYFTFTVGQDGLGSMISSWSFPVSSPFVIYNFDEDADLDPADTEIFIDGSLPIELRGLSTQANFDQLLIDAETQSIIEGRLTIPESMALEIAINPLTDDLSGYTAVAPGSALMLQDGLVLELGRDVVIDAAGLHPRGTHPARISYTGLSGSEWTATYSDNFTFGFAPFTISRGRVDFAAEGIARAYADASGFHLIDQSDPVIAQIPDRLQLPDDQVAYIALKRAGMSLVDIEPAGRNQFSIREKQGIPLELTLPGLDRGPLREKPQYIASLENVVIDAKNGQLVSGQITARATSETAETAFTLDRLGIPIAPTAFTTRNTSAGLVTEIEGQFTLFGKPVQNAEPVTFVLNEKGVVEGEVALDDENIYAFLDGPAGQVSIEVASAYGNIHVPLNAYAAPAIHVDVTGTFNINKGDNIVAGANIGFTYAGEGAVTLNGFSPLQTRRANPSIALGSFDLQIDEITSLSLFYTHNSGLNYVAGLDAQLLPFGDGAASLPLDGIEMHQNSFYFPAQEYHEGVAGFRPFVHDIEVASLDLLAYRIPAALVDRNGTSGFALTSENSLSGIQKLNSHLTPLFDFEVRLDGLNNTSDNLEHLPLTLQNARIDAGVVSGEILPFRPDNLRFPLQHGTLQVNLITGTLNAMSGGQDLQITASGPLDLYRSVAGNFESCTVPGVTITINARGALNGTSGAFKPCGEYSLGPVAAQFEEATLAISTKETATPENTTPENTTPADITQFVLEGEVNGFSRSGSRRMSDARGILKLDIGTGEVLAADVEAEDVFLEFPVAAPRYQINLEETHLSAEGFLLPTDSSLVVNAIGSDADLRLLPSNGFRLGLRPALVNTGTADLFEADNLESRIASLNADGLHVAQGGNNDPMLPHRIAIPGGFGAYIDVLQAGADAIALEQTGKGEYTITTRDGEAAFLVLPQIETAGGHLELPISFDLRLNAALEYIGGDIDENLLSSPVQLFGNDSPVSIVGVRYDSEAGNLQFRASIRPPAAFIENQGDGADQILEARFMLQADGLVAAGFDSQTFPLYNEVLLFSVDDASMIREDERATFKLAGSIDSPLMKQASAATPPLRFLATFEESSASWQLEAQAPAVQSVAIDQARLLIDPVNPPRLNADPMPVLEMNGLLVMPESISEDFVLELSLEIGPGGVYAWHTGTLAQPRTFFGGFLAAHLDALDIHYDGEQQALITTIDGAFEPGITGSAGTIFGDEPADLLPFSGIELATNGKVALGPSFGSFEPDSNEVLNLLGDLPRMPVISQHFWIEALVLKSPGGGLMLDLEGSVRLPTPDGRRIAVGEQVNGETTSLVYSDRIPVMFTLNSEGALLDAAGAPWKPLIAENIVTPSAEGSAAEEPFTISSVFLHFNPRVASDNRIFTTARLALPASASVDSTNLSTPQDILLGTARTPARQPGMIIEQQRPQQYLLGNLTHPGQQAPVLNNALFNTSIHSISLPSPGRLEIELAGISTLDAGAIQGFFPIEGITLTSRGLQDYGQSAGASAFTFAEAGVFETGCLDLGFASQISAGDADSGPNPSQVSSSSQVNQDLSRLTRLQFGASCGDDLRLTLTDKYLAGSFENLIFRNNNTTVDVLLTSAQIGLGNLATLASNLSYTAADSSNALEIDGITTFREIPLNSNGYFAAINGQSRLSVAFTPSVRPLQFVNGNVVGNIAGGGIYLNPTEDDVALVNLVLNERSNNGFSSNRPFAASNAEMLGANQLGLLLPLEISMAGELVDDSLMVQTIRGTGLMTTNEHFTTLDIDAAFLGRPDELGAGLFVAERQHPDSGTLLEGLANISLNYTSVAGGILKANFQADALPDSSMSWSIYGRSDIDVAGVTRIPGKAMLTDNGLLLDLQDISRLQSGPLSLQNDLNLTLWSNQSHEALNGFAAFDAAYELIPGFELATVKMHGSIIQDREAPVFYAARNIFADVPFVYTGPIDPWLSFEDGQTYAGDARNTTFRRMITDVRQFGNAIPQHAERATTALQKALTVQSVLSTSLPRNGNLPYFAEGDSALAQTGSALLALELSQVSEDQLPDILQNLVTQLYNDTGRPEYQRYGNVPASNARTLSALQNMTTSVATARRSAESDIFTLSSLLPRPLLWSSDYVDLTSELSTSPLSSVSWPGSDNGSRPGFNIDIGLQGTHAGNLINFKESNEGLDIQFLRTIGAVELNLVNLKIARSPRQAADFATAKSSIERYYANNIASDWELLLWTRGRQNWLREQEDAVIRGIRENLRAYTDLDNGQDVIRNITLQRYDMVRNLSLDTNWERDDLPEEQRYAQYIETLDEAGLQEEFQVTAKDLWFDVPMAALSALNDTLSSLIEYKNSQFEAGIDSLNTAYGAFTMALDPMYDIQTSFTTSLYGMAEEYSNWRESIRRLDPEAVNYAFQFLPYRGNYRILAEDLIPPTIEDIRITPETNGYVNNTSITWTAEHPVEVSESSIAISVGRGRPNQFATISKTDSLGFYTVKPDLNTTAQDVSVTLRVRGAGGIPAIRKGQFSVPVDPAADMAAAPAGTPLIPVDTTPPAKPTLNNLAYSSYFSETPNTLRFDVAPLDDPDSGLERVEYRIVDNKDEEVLQDWTELQKSTTYFAGRLVETSLPIQGEDVTVRVVVRARNEAGLTSENSSTLALKLDDSSPRAAIANATYYNAFDITHPLSIELALGDIVDEESGIDLIEYALQFNAQAAMANANWQPLLSFPDRDKSVGNTSVFIDLQDENLPDNRFVLSLYLRVTNGAGLQTIVNRAIDIPGPDVTPPSEPLVSLEHSGFYGPLDANQLRIIVGGSQDLESGIASVEYRILDGQTGTDLVSWEPFTFLDPDNPTFILPAIDKTVSLPGFSNSRTVIVETRTINAAGITSNKAVRFIQLDMDDTAPTAPELNLVYSQTPSTNTGQSILLEVGQSQDLESKISDVSYRLVNQTTQQPISNWTSLTAISHPGERFTGVTTGIETSSIPAGVKPGVQVRVMNQQGLQTLVAKELSFSSDFTAPPAPSMLLETIEPEDPESPTALNIYLGPAHDPESGIGQIRYRVRDLQFADSTVVNWTSIALPADQTSFRGRAIRTAVPALTPNNAYLVEAELINTAGLATRVTGIVDQETRIAANEEAPATPALSLFYFDAQNSIRKNELELRIQPDTDLLTRIDSVRYRHTLLDAQGQPVSGRGLNNWRSMTFRTSSPNEPFLTYLPIPENTDPSRSSVEVQLVNENGTSGSSQATLPLFAAEDVTPPSKPNLFYSYSGYHNEAGANTLSLQISGIDDIESRIADVAYRIVNRQNSDDVVVDWTPVDARDEAGLFQPASINLTLPEFSRDRELSIEVQAVNGAGLTASADTALSVIVDRTPPEITEPELVIAGINDTRITPELIVYPGALKDDESNITSVAYRILSDSDSTGAIVDWTQLNIVKGHSVRIPPISASIPQHLLDNALVFELETVNEAGLEANIRAQVRADLDNSAPQMPRVEVAYRESEIGTGYLFVEPGAFRDAESRIASLEYRLVDSEDPSFVLVDWINIPVPRDIRVSVAPIAIPRSEIPYDGAVQLAVEFRATNGAGLFSIRRSTIELPGDVSPPELPSLLVAHRNAYDPLHPNTVEIQIGSSEDEQSAIKQAQYRITNASTGEELASWTQLPVASDGYFPGTILFEELPVIRNSTSLLVEVEVLNTAGLINKISQNVRVDVQNDATPPVADISLYYFANEMALVLDQLADQESKIQKVEYRFLDNVDQSELTDWTDLFEIATPQDRYPKQSFKVQQPAVRSGRTLKVEVRVTNGAGLQTTVSKTVLVRSDD